jgi:FkbM family methyltransferase
MRTIIEVGVNEGQDTPNLLHNADKYYGFEPTLELFNMLQTRYNGDPRVQMIPMAVDIENRFTTFNVAGWNNWGCSSLNDFTDGISDVWGDGRANFHFTKSQKVMTIRMDDFCNMYNITSIDYMHVDAQGSDLNVLKSFGDKIDILKEGRIEVAYSLSLYKNVDNTFESASKWLTEKGFIFDVEYDHPINKTEADIKFRRP